MDEHKLQDNSKAFLVRDGAVLYSIKDLYGHLAIISDEVFNHHVNAEKNDFALWIEHAHGQKFIAAAIRRATSKNDLRKVLFIAMFR